MTSTWQTYQTRLVACLDQQPSPAPRWLLVRQLALATLGPPVSACEDHEPSVLPHVRLPGISRPEGGPLQVRRQ